MTDPLSAETRCAAGPPEPIAASRLGVIIRSVVDGAQSVTIRPPVGGAAGRRDRHVGAGLTDCGVGGSRTGSTGTLPGDEQRAHHGVVDERLKVISAGAARALLAALDPEALGVAAAGPEALGIAAVGLAASPGAAGADLAGQPRMTTEPAPAPRPFPRVDATFGPVGVVIETACAEPGFDVAITSMEGFVAIAHLCLPAPPIPLGAVATVVAVPDPGAHRATSGGRDRGPVLDSVDALRALLGAATAIYCADLIRSTSGRHLAFVAEQLGIGSDVMHKLRVYRSGTESMPALASAPEADAVGFAQLSEVASTAGVRALRRGDGVTGLPDPFARSTVYVAALGAAGRSPEAARRFIDVLTGPGTSALRESHGFVPTP